MLCSWEGNRRSDCTLSMSYRLGDIPSYGSRTVIEVISPALPLVVWHPLLLTRLMGQYCFARWCLSSVSVVCNAAGGPGAWAVRWPTLHGGPVRLRLVRATHCFILNSMYAYCVCKGCPAVHMEQ